MVLQNIYFKTKQSKYRKSDKKTNKKLRIIRTQEINKKIYIYKNTSLRKC